MSTVTFKTEQTKTCGSLPEVGQAAPSFLLTGQDLKDTALKEYAGKKKLLNIFLSLDTGVCAQSVHTFYQRCKGIEDLVVLNISMDLPFAAQRFCQEGKISGVVTLSAFRSSFPEDYGIKITEGPLRGLLARAVVVLDGNDRILYTQLVPEITTEPDYEAALKHIS